MKLGVNRASRFEQFTLLLESQTVNSHTINITFVTIECIDVVVGTEQLNNSIIAVIVTFKSAAYTVTEFFWNGNFYEIF